MPAPPAPGPPAPPPALHRQRSSRHQLVLDLNTSLLNGSQGNGRYQGGGSWTRPGREARVDLTVMAGPTAGSGIAICNATSPAAPNPIQITTSASHGLVTGQAVFIRGVVGNAAANNSPTSAGRTPMHASPATSHLYIVNPLAGGIAGLFRTHPATAERIARLRALAGARTARAA